MAFICIHSSAKLEFDPSKKFTNVRVSFSKSLTGFIFRELKCIISKMGRGDKSFPPPPFLLFGNLLDKKCFRLKMLKPLNGRSATYFFIIYFDHRILV